MVEPGLLTHDPDELDVLESDAPVGLAPAGLPPHPIRRVYRAVFEQSMADLLAGLRASSWGDVSHLVNVLGWLEGTGEPAVPFVEVAEEGFGVPPEALRRLVHNDIPVWRGEQPKRKWWATICVREGEIECEA